MEPTTETTAPVFTTYYRTDKKKREPIRCRHLTYDQCRALFQGSKVNATDQRGLVGTVTITSIKTWKTRPEVEVRWKFGLYEYGHETIQPGTTSDFFCKVLEPES